MLKQFTSAFIGLLAICFALNTNVHAQCTNPPFDSSVKTTIQNLSPSLWVSQLTPGDFDRDGNQDVAVIASNANGGDTLYVMYGDGQGGISHQFTSALLSDDGPPVVADFNGDSFPDVIAGSRVFMSSSAGSLGYSGDLALNGYAIAGDFNNDQRMDLAVTRFGNVTNDAGSIYILHNNGNNGFNTAQHFPFATPVFVDIDPYTIDLDPELVEKHITERTRAIVAVHFAGHPVDLDRLIPLCDKNKLVLIEDCAHAHGAGWNEQRVGSFGAVGSFSFQASKNMTAGEGGILITNDPELAERARSISNQGRRTGGAWYEHPTLGTNARITGFQAALLLNQLNRLPDQLATRMKRATFLRSELENIKGLTPTPLSLDERVTMHGYHIFSMTYDPTQWSGVPRDKVVAALRAEGVPVTSGYPYPIYHNELFRKHQTVVHPCPEAEAYCQSSIWLPHNALLAEEEWLEKVVTAIAKVRDSVGELAAANR